MAEISPHRTRVNSTRIKLLFLKEKSGTMSNKAVTVVQGRSSGTLLVQPEITLGERQVICVKTINLRILFLKHWQEETINAGVCLRDVPRHRVRKDLSILDGSPLILSMNTSCEQHYTQARGGGRGTWHVVNLRMSARVSGVMPPRRPAAMRRIP